MIVWTALERVRQRAAADEAALLLGRDEWNARAGLVHDDEPLYEERAAAFLDWFALDRRDEAGLSPVEKQLAGEPAGSAERAALSALASSHRTLFRVRELLPAGSTSGLVLDDLCAGGVFRARERRNLGGVARGDLVDARVVADIEAPPDLLLVGIACVHPRDAESAILRLVEESRRAHEPREELLFRLLRLRLRCEHYHHVAPARVYEAGEHQG